MNNANASALLSVRVVRDYHDSMATTPVRLVAAADGAGAALVGSSNAGG